MLVEFIVDFSAVDCCDPLRLRCAPENVWSDRVACRAASGVLRQHIEHLRARHENDGCRRSIYLSDV
jgi:hypothetical protein